MKLQNVKRPILLFLRTCFLFPLFYGVISVPLIMVASVTGVLGSKYGTQIVIYLFYFWLMDMIFYGGSKNQNRYLFSLESGKTYTLKEDFLLFLSQEGLAVMCAYAVYAIPCFILKDLTPKTTGVIVSIFSLTYTLPIAPSSFIKTLWIIEYLVCLISFCVIYVFTMMWHRARLRKKWL